MDAKTQSQGSTEELAGSLPKENRDREKPSPMIDGFHERSMARNQS